jgi:hypothetical protein
MEIAGQYKYGDQVKLLEDVKSHFKKGKLYGKKNDIVTIISYSEPVLCVEDKNKERFSVRIEFVTLHN